MPVKLFILGLPGSGKSAIARSLLNYLGHRQVYGQNDQQWSMARFNDYPILLEMFRQDSKGRQFRSTLSGGFDMLDPKVVDEALQMLEQKVDAQLNSPKLDAKKFTIVEFSRNNYHHAFQQFNKSFLTEAYFLYLQAEVDVCKERIQQRVVNPRFEEDDHPVSDYIFENYYYGDDGEHLVKILMQEYQVDRRRILIAKNNGSVEEVLADIHRFVDIMFEDKVVVQRASRFLSEDDKTK